MGSIYGKIWCESEDDFLKENYSKIGPSGCSKVLNRTIRSCRERGKKLLLKYNITKEYYMKDNLEKIVNESLSYAECIRKIGLSNRPGNYDTLKKYIKIHNISIEHFYTNSIDGLLNYTKSIKIDILDILVEHSSYDRTKLKNRLYKEGFKKRECEECGQGEEWRGKKISLIIDHINGVNNDNRLLNLRILCPNCNATLDTHCGRKMSIYREKVTKKNSCCICGVKIYKGSKKCVGCNTFNLRKVERPSLEQLLLDIEVSNYVLTGKKYGVSDNTIRKWMRKYEKEVKVP